MRTAPAIPIPPISWCPWHAPCSMRPRSGRTDAMLCWMVGATGIEPVAPATSGQCCSGASGTGPVCPPSEDVLWRQAKHDLTHRLVVQYAPLALLRDRVNVAQTALERVFLEHRHR